MSKEKTEAEILQHKDKSISILNDYMTDLVATDKKKADLLSYWLHTYTNYLKFEERFEPTKNKRYERGDIIQVNLGFNVGSEHGGLHYAVVLDNNNAHNSPVLTIIPLSSSNGDNIHSSEVYLGDDFYQKMKNKISGIIQAYVEQLAEINVIKELIQNTIESLKQREDNIELDEFTQQLNLAQSQLDLLQRKENSALKKKAEFQKVAKEIQKMKRGSVALVNQITTVSKIRIVDPANNHGVLNGIKLSPDNLDNINAKIQQLFLKKCVDSE